MKKIIKYLIPIIIFIIIISLLTILVIPKYQTDLIEGSLTSDYYKEEVNHDIIFLGDCEVYANINPMVLYEEYGISSYVRGNSQQLIWQSYYLLKETLKYETPKIVVFNVNSMRYNKPVKESYNRLMLDNMKWSKEKIDAINASMTEDENILYYMFPILRYHSRITDLTSEDFNYYLKRDTVSYNGFLINQNVKPYTSFPTKKKLSSYEFSDIDYKYLDMILDLCNENGIKLVLMKAPSLYPYWYDEYEKQIVDYASKNNLDYYNLYNARDEIGIDYSTDTYDGGLHLNLNGSIKLAKYFGNILKNNYTLTDYRTDEKVSNIYKEKLKLYYEEVNK